MPLSEAAIEQRVREELLARLSHKLRTPLTVILGYAELLTDGIVGELTPQQADYVARMQASGEELLQLLNELLRESGQG